MKHFMLFLFVPLFASNLLAQPLSDTAEITEHFKKVWKEWYAKKAVLFKTLYFNNKDSTEKYSLSRATSEITSIVVMTHLDKQHTQIEYYYFLNGELFRILILNTTKGFIGMKKQEKSVAYYFINGNMVYETGKNYEKVNIDSYVDKVKRYYNKALLLLKH